MNLSNEQLRYTRPIILNEGTPSDKKKEILQYFLKTYEIYEELYKQITHNEAFYLKPEPLRHPLIFYLGHTATVYVNKLIIAGILKNHINPEYETMFAVGVDEMSWDDLNTDHYNWPKVDEVFLYRNIVKEMITTLIQTLPLEMPINWENPFWIIIMGIEHERIHLETSSVIMRRLGVQYMNPSKLFERCHLTKSQGYDELGVPKFLKERVPKNELLEVSNQKIILTKDDKLYGWDNEYGLLEKDVNSFNASKYLVSNSEYYEFMMDQGYERHDLWTEEGSRWVKSTKSYHPLFWIPEKDSKGNEIYLFRTMSEIIEMPWDWPVETNYLEAKAFCNWKSFKSGKHIRLPTEPEYYCLRNMIKEDVIDWEFGTQGNINLEKWASSCPIDIFETNGFYDIIGNVWQHNETEINGFPGFKVHKVYDDFSTPTFDRRHNIIKGGSWISTGNEAMKSARYAFRRHFFQHAGFRYVEAEMLPIIDSNSLLKNFYEADSIESQNIDFNFGEEYFKFKKFGKKSAELIVKLAKKIEIKMDKILEVGCGVGRTTFELAKNFKNAYGLDKSARFFHLAVDLKENGRLNYVTNEDGDIGEYKEINLNDFDFNEYRERTQFHQQQDLCNIDLLKFNEFDVIYANNLIDTFSDPKIFLINIKKHLKENGLLIISSSYQWNIERTPKNNWLGGFKEAGENKSSFNGLKEILEKDFYEIKNPKDVPYVIKENKRKYQQFIAQLTFWQRKY